jgi:hypothetical protein
MAALQGKTALVTELHGELGGPLRRRLLTPVRVFWFITAVQRRTRQLSTPGSTQKGDARMRSRRIWELQKGQQCWLGRFARSLESDWMCSF